MDIRFNQKQIAVDLGPEIIPTIDPSVSQAAESLITDVPPVWCPGCGDYRFLDTLRMALAYLQLDPDQVAIISGIGCSGRTPQYLDTYGFHGIHGGPVPTALGVHLANEKLTTIVIGGDGDTLAIGGGFLPHAARRNPNLTVIILNNGIYGLTKGQASPTTVLRKTATTPFGAVEETLNPTDLALTYKATFLARVYAGELEQKELAFRTLVAAIKHQGFAVIDWPTACSTFNVVDVGARVERYTLIPEDHDVTDRAAATVFARDPSKTYYGIFHQIQHRTFADRLAAAERAAQKATGGPITVDALFDQFA